MAATPSRASARLRKRQRGRTKQTHGRSLYWSFMKVAFQIRPEFSKHVETDVGHHGEPKRDSAISRGGLTIWLPSTRNKCRAGRAPDARERERLTSVIMPRQERALKRVLGAAENTCITRNAVAIVFVQGPGYSERQRVANHVLGEGVTDSQAVSFGAAAPFLGSSVGLPDSSGGRREDKG